MIATFAFILLLAQVTTATEKTFTDYIIDDIEYDYWALDEIRDFLDSDIIDGYMEDDAENKVLYILPDNQITRAEFIKLIITALGIHSYQKHNVFTDVKESDWFYSYVTTANSLGIINGKENNKFKPNDYITRAEMAAVIVRAFEESIPFSNEQTIRYQDIDSTHWAFDEVNKASSMGIVKGKSTNLFKPNDLATRAESIVMIHRALNSEAVNLPDETKLITLIENHLIQEKELLEKVSIDEAIALYESDSTGYYRAYQQIVMEVSKDQLATEELYYRSNFEKMKIQAVLVSDRRTVIEVTDIYVKNNYGGHWYESYKGFTYFLLKDSPSMEWKIYSKKSDVVWDKIM